MPYSYKSNKFLLPANVNDYYDPEEEKRKVDIIDRALDAITKLGTPGHKGHGIIQEGLYVGTFIDNNSRVELIPTLNFPAIFAFIDSIPVYSTETITWSNLQNNTTYYLYLKLIEDQDYIPEQSSRRFGNIEPVAYTYTVPYEDHLLVAQVNITDDSIGIIVNPEGKIVIYSISDYDADIDGIIDNTKLLDGKSLEYILNRANHLGRIDWATIDTSTHQISSLDLEESERVSLRIKELFGSYLISGDLPQPSTGLEHRIPSQIVSVEGVRVITTEQLHSYLMGRDTYIDVGTDGILYFIEVLKGEDEPNVEPGRYRLFKVIVEEAKKAEGKIVIQRRPTPDDTINISGTIFTAVDNPSPGINEFYIGNTDTPNGWIECALSLASAINNSDCPVIASVSGNVINLEYNIAGDIGNQEIVINISKPGDITYKGLSGGHNNCIIEVEDRRKEALSYWKEPVETKSDLPSKAINGSTRLVLDENTFYRYSTNKKYGTGSIKIIEALPNDRLEIGDIVVEATSGIESIENKLFSITGSTTDTLQSLKKVINSTIYPPSNVTAILKDDYLEIRTNTTDSSGNKPIQLLVGDSNRYELSGIEGANEDEGWIPVSGSTSGISYADTTRGIIRDWQISTSGQTLFTTQPYEDNTLLVFKNGIYQERGEDKDYIEVGSSGIEFRSGLDAGDIVGLVSINPSAGISSLFKDLTLVTINPHQDKLPSSLDLQSHHKIHSEIDHNEVKITDPGDLYLKQGEYSVLGEHIGDKYAHTPNSLTYYWKILEGDESQNFEVQGSNVKDYSTLLFDVKSTEASGVDYSFWYEETSTPFIKVLDTSETTLPTAIITNEEIIFFGKGKAYLSSQSGIDWITETFTLTSLITNAAISYNDSIYVGINNNKVYKRDGVTKVWSEECVTSGVETKSLSTFNDQLILGADGEIYRYDEENKLYEEPLLDLPVAWITALQEYGGLLFIATQTPNKLYKFDGEVYSEETISLTGYITHFVSYLGKLYAGSNDGKIYVKDGIEGDWQLVLSTTGSSTNFSISFDGGLYVAIGKSLYKSTGSDEFNKLYTFEKNIDSILSVSPTHIYISYEGDVYRFNELVQSGLQRVPYDGLDGALNKDRIVSFVISDKDILQNIKKTGSLYIRYKQFPTDNKWYNYPEVSAGGGGGGTSLDEKVKASSTDTTAGYLDAKVKNSIEVDNNKLQLKGDVSSPGNNKYYGTNNEGTKGFFNLPSSTEVSTYPVEFNFLIRERIGLQSFDIQASPYKNFESLVFDKHSNITDSEGYWEFEAGYSPWSLSKDTDAPVINDLIVFENKVFAAGSNGKIYKSEDSGISFTEEWAGVGKAINCFTTVSGIGLVAGLDSPDIYYRSGVEGQWVKFDDVPVTSITALTNINNKLWVAGNGEVYLYYPEFQNWWHNKAPYIDLPVTKISAISDWYNGKIFIGTEGPCRIYKQDASGVSISQEFTSFNSINDFAHYNGKMYVSVKGSSRVYVFSTETPFWQLSFSCTGNSINSLFNNFYDNCLYAGNSDGIVYKFNGVDWGTDYDLKRVSAVDFVKSFTLLDRYLLAGTGNSGKIFIKKSYYVGWSRIPTTGIDGNEFAGHKVRYVLTNSQDFLKEGICYIRYRQKSTQGTSDWEYAYLTDIQTPQSQGDYQFYYTIKPGIGNQHFQVQVSKYKDFSSFLLNRKSWDNPIGFEYTRPSDHPDVWYPLPEDGVDATNCKVRYTVTETNTALREELNKVSPEFVRWRQSGINGYGAWEYATTGFIKHSYSFFRSPGIEGSGIDGFRESFSDQILYKAKVRLSNLSSKEIVVNLKVNESYILEDNIVVPIGAYYAENYSFKISNLLENDVITCDILEGDSNVKGISVSLLTLEFTG
ncbi:MAG TPA: hypothetical protein P5513_04225 [Candidatus Diapherotrites archaeon]|nr:hypothetical protein [Candidatus Diapherotrites archaeon]